ncbi:hypothetical protein [Nonomuraea sp. NPDC050310]|uniref:hypothetical protein n=1 Tax=Nonomuraea sp. NPDC050310 TaxID=3154935 RepID=UPI00340BB628
MTTPSPGDELRAAVSARRDLGPEFEDALVESFLDKLGSEVDRRVDQRVAAAEVATPATRDGRSDGMRLALAIVSLALGTIVTIAILATTKGALALIPVWAGIVLVNVVFTQSTRKP